MPSKRQPSQSPQQGFFQFGDVDDERVLNGRSPRHTQPTLAEIEAEITRLKKKIAPDLKKIAKLKRIRAGRLGGSASGPHRVRGDAEMVAAKWRQLGGGRNDAKTVAQEFNCSVRTVQRKLVAARARG